MIERLRVRIPAGAAGEFLLQSQLFVLTLIRCPFHPRVTAVARKNPSNAAKSAGGRLHLNTHTPLTQRIRSGLTMPRSGHTVRTYQGNELTRNSSGNTRSQSSQLAEPLWIDPVLKSGISVRELISTLTKEKKGGGGAQAGNELSNILPIPSHAGKKTPRRVRSTRSFGEREVFSPTCVR